MSDYTNFNGYSHGDLRRMVGSMDSGGIMSAADPWRRAADTLKQIRTSLNTASGDAVSSWEGDTSEVFHTKMVTLAASINNVAAYANDAAVTLELMSAAIDDAKRTMPEEPGFWSKAADAVGDTAASATGTENEDTKTAVTDEKKAEAVAVMNLLASRYRTATDYLRPPRPGVDDSTVVPAPDSAGPAALSSMIMGAGVGFAGANNSGSPSAKSRPAGSVGGIGAQPPTKFQPSGPTDPGVKGGTANPPASPKSPGSFGTATGLDGVVVSPKPGTTGLAAPATHGNGLGAGTGGGSGNGFGASGVIGGPGTGSKVARSNGFAGASGQQGNDSRRGAGSTGSRAGSVFGASGMPGSGGTAGGGAPGGASGAAGNKPAGGQGSSMARRAGGTAGAVGASGAGRGAFTEGGSGIGRGRGQAGQGTSGPSGGMPGASQVGKKDKKDKRRPDYLVEDEETWASGKPTNPNVVE